MSEDFIVLIRVEPRASRLLQRGMLFLLLLEFKGKVFDNEKEINDAVFMYDGHFISLW